MSSNHPRNTRSMLSSPRCGAKTLSGKPCMSPAVSGKKRCRMHGGAFGPGAPVGNDNALKHGLHTRRAIKERRQLRDLLRQSRELVLKMDRTDKADGRAQPALDYSEQGNPIRD